MSPRAIGLPGCHPYTLAFCMGEKEVPIQNIWRTVTEISVTADYFPLAPPLRVSGSPHLVLSAQICLGDLSASVGILGRPNSRSPAAGASPGTALNRGSPRVSGTSTHPLVELYTIQIVKRWENTMHRLTISLRVLSPASPIPLSCILILIYYLLD